MLKFIIIIYVISLLFYKKSNDIKYDQYDDYKYGSVRGYYSRTRQRERDHRKYINLTYITIWIIRIAFIYLIFSGELNDIISNFLN